MDRLWGHYTCEECNQPERELVRCDGCGCYVCCAWQGYGAACRQQMERGYAREELCHGEAWRAHHQVGAKNIAPHPSTA